MSEKQHFHPLALLVNFFYLVRGTFYLFLLILFQNNQGILRGGWLAGGLLFLLLCYAGVKYWFAYYEISPEQVVVYQGIFRKKETILPYERMQTIKQRQWFFFRPFGVTQVLIETAGGNGAKAEASLPAVPQQVLEQIETYRQKELAASQAALPLAESLGEMRAENNTLPQPEINGAASNQTTATYVYQITNGQICLFGLTDLSMLAAALALLAVVQEIPARQLEEALTFSSHLLRGGWLVILGLVVLGVLLLIGVSLIRNFMHYYHFQVSRDNQTLTIESGLLERKVQKIPLEKIQGIRVNQQVLRKFLGLSSVELLLAGGQESSGEAGSSKLYFLPIVSDRLLYEVLQFLLPEWHFEKPQLHYCGRDKLWYFLRWFLWLVPVSGVAFFFNPWVGGVLTLVTALFLFGAGLDSRFQGYQIQSSQRICVQGYLFLTRRLTYVEKNKIQDLTVTSSYWLAKKGLGGLQLALKEGNGSLLLELRYLEEQLLGELQGFFRKTKA